MRVGWGTIKDKETKGKRAGKGFTECHSRQKKGGQRTGVTRVAYNDPIWLKRETKEGGSREPGRELLKGV